MKWTTWKQWSWMIGLAVLLGASSAAADGSTTPASNQAFLYEMAEDAMLLNSAGHVLVPSSTSPTGLVDSTDGTVGIPAFRRAISQLQGLATLGSVLCPLPEEVTVGSNECTVIAVGTDNVALVIDSAGNVVPTSGAVSGVYAVVVQLDNGTDSPEMPVQTGTFNGVINFQLPQPLGFISNGRFTVDGKSGSFPFNAVFRMPFRLETASSRLDTAYYMMNSGDLQEVQPEERAQGWPTVRFDISF